MFDFSQQGLKITSGNKMPSYLIQWAESKQKYKKYYEFSTRLIKYSNYQRRFRIRHSYILLFWQVSHPGISAVGSNAIELISFGLKTDIDLTSKTGNLRVRCEDGWWCFGGASCSIVTNIAGQLASGTTETLAASNWLTAQKPIKILF